jgi:HSP20 family protein
MDIRKERKGRDIALRRWSPGRDILSMRDELHRVINELFAMTAGDEDTRTPSIWMPAVDTYETDDAVVLKVEIPGFSKDDFSLEVRQNTLTLQGERRQEVELKEEGYHCRERAYGRFERSFILPTTVDQDRMQATYKDGVLEVRLPKTEAAQPKRVAIAG